MELQIELIPIKMNFACSSFWQMKTPLIFFSLINGTLVLKYHFQDYIYMPPNMILYL